MEPGPRPAPAYLLPAFAQPILTHPRGPTLAQTVETIFGLPQTTLGDCLREPAGGLLDLTSVLSLLDIALLLILAASLGDKPRVTLLPEDAARIGAAVGLTAAGVLATLVLGLATGLELTPVTASLAALSAATAVAGGRVASDAVDAPLQQCAADLRALLPFGGGNGASDGDDGDEQGNVIVGTFYRSSTLIGLIVGASFVFSPVSPISIFDTEAALTRMLRQDLGVYISFVVCAAEASLFRFARDGLLATPRAKALNLLTGLTVCLLVNDGLAQVNQGTALVAALDPSDPLVQEILGGDSFRATTNLDAAYALGNSIGLVYLVQGLRPGKEEADA